MVQLTEGLHEGAAPAMSTCAMGSFKSGKRNAARSV
jgi:hypothetical protein